MYLRKDLYAKEASALLRAITLYRVVLEAQIYRFFPGKESVVENLLRHLVRQGRIVYCSESMRYAATKQDLQNPDKGMRQALWVLLDFIGRIEFHSPSDFPVKIVFFANSEMYEIIYVPYENEMLVAQVMSQEGEDVAKRIVIVETAEQIKSITMSSVAGFCTVEDNGSIQYYKFQ